MDSSTASKLASERLRVSTVAWELFEKANNNNDEISMRKGMDNKDISLVMNVLVAFGTEPVMSA